MKRRRFTTAFAPALRVGGVVLALASPGCDGRGPTERRITRTRQVEPAAPTRKAIDSTSAERFGFPYVWDVPEGWRAEPSRQGGMRLGSFSAAGGDVEVSLSALPGQAGGVAANVNRWRKQMGLDPLGAGRLQQLPRLEVLGRPGVVVELEGTYRGMSGLEQEGWGLLGVLVRGPSGGTVFVKATGPAETVRAERERFEAFCSSLEATDA